MAGEQAQYLHQNGAGYTINKKAWQDASATGLKQWAAHSRDFSRELAAHALIQYDTYGIIDTWIKR